MSTTKLKRNSSTKRFKKIYLEITNACNLSCEFCIQNQRKIKFITIQELKLVLDKLEPYTNYLYFHVLGEPLMHPDINTIINLASQKFYVNITTNGYLINKIKENPNIRQINISLHSFHPKYQISLQEYLKNIFDSIDSFIKNNTYISLRLWVKTPYMNEIKAYINKRYHCNIELKNNSYKIHNYLFINSFHSFIWPDLKNNYYNEKGTCYALKEQIGILSDGTIIPCCLDSEGSLALGNIYKDDLDEVISNEKFQNMLIGFRNHQKREELCKHCQFISK